MPNDSTSTGGPKNVVGIVDAKGQEAASTSMTPPAARSAQSPPATFAQSMQYETRKSRRRFGRYVVTFVMLIGIIVPLFLAFYYAVLANDRYVTVSQFSVRAATQPSGLSDIISSTTGIPSAAGMLGAFQDAFVIREFVHSQELADRIDNKLDLEGLFSGEHIDWWSRLDAGSTREEKYDYLQHRMSADLDATTGLIKLTVAGFTAEDSLKITQETLVACQELVNRLSEQAREDALSFAAAEVAKAENRLRDARIEVTKFRKTSGDIFPEATARSQLEMIAQLDFELAKSKAELAALGLDRRAPTQRAALARIAALEGQIVQERAKLTGPAVQTTGSDSISDVLIDYQALELDRLFAEEFYRGTLVMLEASRQEAIRIQRYLVVFVKPGLAQEPIEPRRVWAVLTVFACSLAALLVLAVLYKTVREHVV